MKRGFALCVAHVADGLQYNVLSCCTGRCICVECMRCCLGVTMRHALAVLIPAPVPHRIDVWQRHEAMKACRRLPVSTRLICLDLLCFSGSTAYVPSVAPFA